MPLTKQAYHELLVRTSSEGRFPSSRGVNCLYRSGDGRACGVGLLIPDERYNPAMDDTTLDDLGCYCVFQKFNLYDLIPEGMSMSDLIRVQEVHDGNCGYKNAKEWDHEKFVSELNDMPCFADCVRGDEGATNAD